MRRWIALALALALAGAAHAKTTGVGEDASLQSGPCYQTLSERNIEHPSTAPPREIGAACVAENGDVEKAWARIQRLWGSDGDQLPDYDNYRSADAPLGGSLSLWQAYLGAALAFLALGTPFRSGWRLASRSGPPAREGPLLALALIVRAALGLGLAQLAALRFVTALAALGLIVVAAMRARPRGASAVVANGFAADLVNDAYGAAAGLFAFALFTRNGLGPLAAGLALSLVASAPPLVRLRALARARAQANLVIVALFAAFAGMALIADPGAALIAEAPWSGAWTPLALALIGAGAIVALGRPDASEGA